MKVLIVSQSQKNIAVLRALIEGEGHMDVTVGGVEVLATAAQDAGPGFDLVLVDGLTEDAAGWNAIDRVTERHPQTQVIALAAEQTPELLRQAMRVGVREVLTPPVHKSQFHDTLQRIAQKASAAMQHSSRGRVIAFQACKGGSGATFLAANLASVLAHEHGKRVGLIDLNLQFGDAVLFVFDHLPRATIADVSRQIERLDASFLVASMVQVAPNFSVLAAPEDPDQAATVQAAHIDQIIKVAREAFDFVVLDLGRNIDSATIHALDHSDLVFPVLQETLPFLRDTKRMLKVYASLGYGEEKLKLVVNRFEKGGDITIDDVEKALGVHVARIIPNSYKAVAASVNQGVPVARLADHDVVSKALREMAEELVGAPAPGKQEGGWFRHVFKG